MRQQAASIEFEYGSSEKIIMSKVSTRRVESLEAENARLRSKLSSYRRINTFDVVGKIFGDVARAAMVVLPFMFMWFTAASLAGKQTETNINATVQGGLVVESGSLGGAASSLFKSSTFSFLALMFGVGGVLYGVAQGKVRGRYARRLLTYEDRGKKVIDSNQL